ncbi:MAG: hypothetical protein ACRCY3_07915 [Sphingorhabdus sp.]
MLKERVNAAQKIATDLHAAENAIDDAIVKIAKLAGTLPTARIETRMSAIVGQDAVAKVTEAVAAAGQVRQMLTDAHYALSNTQKQVGLGARMFGAGMDKPKLHANAIKPTNQNDADEIVAEAIAIGSFGR